MTARWQLPEEVPEAVVASEVADSDSSWTRCSHESEEEEALPLELVTGDWALERTARRVRSYQSRIVV